MAAPRPASRPEPCLYLVTPEIDDAAAFAGTLAAAMGAADVAAVLLRLRPDGENALTKRVKALATIVQDKAAALVLYGHPDLVARAGADGAHLAEIEAFLAAAPGLKPERIAGAGGLVTRHDAMIAAENGADYVMFGEPNARGQRPAFDAILERVQWWAEVFEAPCVGYAARIEDVAPLAAAGADFIALGNCVWEDPRGAAAAMTDAASRLALAEAGA
ncbi:MAG TPA: thiamine phosphate synthase [Pseudolabrys sp.]|nr:thiamine phosphate synthase [Pseudolabrys sp.]